MQIAELVAWMLIWRNWLMTLNCRIRLLPPTDHCDACLFGMRSRGIYPEWWYPDWNLNFGLKLFPLKWIDRITRSFNSESLLRNEAVKFVGLSIQVSLSAHENAGQ